ncbi:hypothetical protein [Cupriavidus sp. AU9028]|uniref:hypothetical protein n=1 Tax=Cupriavidus sp. AU9028 TaxID=2871157 RepID=UPI001C94FC12|nr:hypothetical protein [Cupriavidus sp. AU9028]MBY4898504.1 hypothetical protein [Cupriavidus sp. AU9028]
MRILYNPASLTLPIHTEMRIILAILAAVALSGCTVYSKVKLYDGLVRDADSVAQLYVDPHVVVRRFDNKTEKPGERALVHSAGKRREIVEMLPGEHEVEVQFFLLCRKSEVATMRFFAEAGERYRLTYDIGPNSAWWRPKITKYGGEEITDQASMFDSMCRVQIIRILR